MVMLNARCRRCKRVFPSGFNIGGGTATFAGNTIYCPYCGAPGDLIVNGTTIEVQNEQLTVTRGFLSPADLAVAASTFTRFQERQDNRAEVEQQIAAAFPQLQDRIQRLSNERLILFISLLLTIMSTWHNNLPAVTAALQQVEQVVSAAQQVVQKAEDQTLAEAFEAYESGKQSVHALRKKIARFFPQTETELHTVGFNVLAILATALPGLFMIWQAQKQSKASLKEFKSTQQQDQQVVELLRRIVKALETNDQVEIEKIKRMGSQGDL
jgi:hypothetical protein